MFLSLSAVLCSAWYPESMHAKLCQSCAGRKEKPHELKKKIKSSNIGVLT